MTRRKNTSSLERSKKFFVVHTRCSGLTSEISYGPSQAQRPRLPTRQAQYTSECKVSFALPNNLLARGGENLSERGVHSEKFSRAIRTFDLPIRLVEDTQQIVALAELKFRFG